MDRVEPAMAARLFDGLAGIGEPGGGDIVDGAVGTGFEHRLGDGIDQRARFSGVRRVRRKSGPARR